MNPFYAKYIENENEYYRTLTPGTPKDTPLTPAVMEDALNWICRDHPAVLDFGCGSGGLAILSALRGARSVLGIDLAEEGIRYARSCAEGLPQCCFLHGSVEQLFALPDDRFDSLILSNILDNLRPEDSVAALAECVRALRPGGKALIKLNPVLSPQQIRDWKIRVIDGDLLDDGLVLWNRDDGFWQSTLRRYFSELCQLDVYYPGDDQHNRLFLCVK